MRSGTATKKQIAEVAKRFRLTEHQQVLDIHHGFAIVIDRKHQKFTVLSPGVEFAQLRPGPFSQSANAIWTVNLKAAYRAAEAAAKQLASKKAVPVIYQHKANNEMTFRLGGARAEAGRIVVRDATSGKRIESHYFQINHWPGTPARAKALIANMTKATQAYTKARAQLKKAMGRNVRYIDELTLVEASLKPSEEEKA